MRRGVYPGSFNPPTRAHIAIAAAAIEQRNLDRLTLAVSRQAFDKARAPGPPLEQRVAVIEASVRHLGVVDVAITDARLIAEIAEGFDVVVMGQDKWEQLWDLRYYDSTAERDRLLQTLPEVAVAPRPSAVGLGPGAGPSGSGPADAAPPLRPEVVLALDPALATVSSTRARTAEPAIMTPQARASGLWR